MSEPKRTKIPLQYPIIGPDGAITELVMRDPNYDDYMEFDEPWTYQFTEGGKAIPIDHGPTIALYVQRCLVEPKSHLLLSQCTIKDGIALKRWLTRFFTDDGPKTGASTTPSETSSTATAG